MGAGMENWQATVGFVFAIVVSILAVMVPFLIHVKKSNKEAHDGIVKNIERVEGKVDEGFKEVRADIKVLIAGVSLLKGRQEGQERIGN